MSSPEPVRVFQPVKGSCLKDIARAHSNIVSHAPTSQTFAPLAVVEQPNGEKKKKFEFWDLLDTVTNSASAHTRLPNDASDGLRSFAEYVLQKTDDTRPSAAQAMAFPWVATCPVDAQDCIAECVNDALQVRPL